MLGNAFFLQDGGAALRAALKGEPILPNVDTGCPGSELAADEMRAKYWEAFGLRVECRSTSCTWTQGLDTDGSPVEQTASGGRRSSLTRSSVRPALTQLPPTTSLTTSRTLSHGMSCSTARSRSRLVASRSET